ncbi:MAG: LacI family transcriptional regulator [Bacteroidetes bacterium]|nr:MAG: LacI family transcriptional regulator [Bacteroidota bacterium]
MPSKIKKDTTIKDIANLLKTTPATVSRALNDLPEISDQMKKQVRAAARKLDYEKNKIASSLRSGRTKTIGVIIPTAEQNFFGSVVHGIVDVAEMYGYDVIIHQSNESHLLEKKGVQSFLAARVEGILASVAKDTVDFSHFLQARKKKLPIVFFDRVMEDLGIPTVGIDDYGGAYRATEHLFQQGYRRIAHISGPKDIKIFRERLRGYSDAVKAHKKKLDETLIFQGDLSIESGKLGASHFLEMKDPPDAIFAVEDFTALGVIKELKERNVSVPDKFGVIGFCNEMFGLHITPTLSTIDQQTVEMGREAFRLIYDIIVKGKKYRGNHVKNIVLDAIPIYRQSSNRQKP